MGKLRHQEVKEFAQEVGLGFEPMLCSFCVPPWESQGNGPLSLAAGVYHVSSMHWSQKAVTLIGYVVASTCHPSHLQHGGRKWA